MDNKEHTLMLIVGRTSSGKDSLTDEICKRTKYKKLVSYTTRSRRAEESDTHIFATDKDYEEMNAKNRIAAYTEIGDYKYWCTVDQLYENDIYIIDFTGIKFLKGLQLPNLRLVTIFINTPDEIRERRAFNVRKDNKEVFRKRNSAEREQFREMLRDAEFDYAVSNIDFAKSYSVVKWICDVEGLWKNYNTMEEL